MPYHWDQIPIRLPMVRVSRFGVCSLVHVIRCFSAFVFHTAGNIQFFRVRLLWSVGLTRYVRKHIRKTDHPALGSNYIHANRTRTTVSRLLRHILSGCSSPIDQFGTRLDCHTGSK